MKFRKKPVVIEAVQWDGTNTIQIEEFINKGLRKQMDCWNNKVVSLIIPTLEGEHIASINDWIIRGVKGEFYPCKPDIFEQTYDKC